jgi:hypothetical protein
MGEDKSQVQKKSPSTRNIKNKKTGHKKYQISQYL